MEIFNLKKKSNARQLEHFNEALALYEEGKEKEKENSNNPKRKKKFQKKKGKGN